LVPDRMLLDVNSIRGDPRDSAGFEFADAEM